MDFRHNRKFARLVKEGDRNQEGNGPNRPVAMKQLNARFRREDLPFSPIAPFVNDSVRSACFASGEKTQSGVIQTNCAVPRGLCLLICKESCNRAYKLTVVSLIKKVATCKTYENRLRVSYIRSYLSI